MGDIPETEGFINCINIPNRQTEKLNEQVERNRVLEEENKKLEEIIKQKDQEIADLTEVQVSKETRLASLEEWMKIQLEEVRLSTDKLSEKIIEVYKRMLVKGAAKTKATTSVERNELTEEIQKMDDLCEEISKDIIKSNEEAIQKMTIKMDEFLPSEILAKIASNLTYKDVNSLLRTSKTAHAKLTPYRHILPKIPCWIRVGCRSDKICLEAIFYMNHEDDDDYDDDDDDGERTMTAYLFDRIENGADELSEEENRDRVVRFYKSNRDATVEERTFQGRLEGLSLHIQIIQSFASIVEIWLNDVDDDLILEELARLMRQSQSRIDNISIYPKEFRLSNLEFITACKPRSLKVRGEREVHLPDNFYNLPAIQRLTDLNLNDLSDEKTVHNFSLLSATDICILGNHNITIDDVEQIIIQWAESKRRISCIVIDFNNSLNEQTCMEWIEHLDNGLFEAKPVIHKEREWILTRRCDCTKIKFEFAYFYLDICSAG